MLDAECCEKNVAQGQMQYINCKNIQTSIMVLAVVPIVVQIWVSLYFDTIWRETWDCLAVCNVTGLAVQYYITYLRNGHTYILQYCLEDEEDLVRKCQ